MLSIDIDDINQSIDKLSPKNGGGGDDDEVDATKNTSRYVRFIHGGSSAVAKNNYNYNL